VADPVADRPHMSDYGVDTPAWTPLPWSWARERLDAARNLWLVTVSADGRPHSMPVWGVWDDDAHRFAFSCAPGARKARNLRAHDRCVITTESTVECVSVEGRAALLGPGPRSEAWIDRYLAKYQAMAAQLSADFLRANLLFEMTPERAFAVIEREDEFATRATRWTFAP
jgi:Pyridoxamine 5'-phosphate oxidase